MKIYASLIQAYVVCPRQAWLLAHQISGDQYNEFLEIGRLLTEETYKRDKKEILIEGNKIDIIKNKDGTLTIVEIKKSSKRIKAAKMQLLHYLYSLCKKGYIVKGEIRVPKEKKVIEIDFTKKEKIMVEKIHEDIKELISKENPPIPKRIGACKNCSYNEFCWS